MIQKTKKLNVTTQKQIKQIKLALVGDAGTGKSSFLNRYINAEFKQNYQPTLGVQSGTKVIESPNGATTNITIWDFSGKLDFVEIRNEFYKQADLVLLFCDLSAKSSVESLDYWVREAKDNGSGAIIVVGNKMDVKKVGDAEKASKDKGCSYVEISAKTGDGITELIKKVITECK